MRDKIVSEIFDDIIEVDFNPDIVQVGLLDAYDEGHRNGLLTGVCGTLIIGGILYFVKKQKEKKNERDNHI